MDILITGSWPINRRKTRTRLTVVGNRSFQTLQSNKKWRSANQHSARTQNGWTTQFPNKSRIGATCAGKWPIRAPSHLARCTLSH